MEAFTFLATVAPVLAADAAALPSPPRSRLGAVASAWTKPIGARPGFRTSTAVRSGLEPKWDRCGRSSTPPWPAHAQERIARLAVARGHRCLMQSPTFARDARALADAGFVSTGPGPVDQFLVGRPASSWWACFPGGRRPHLDGYLRTLMSSSRRPCSRRAQGLALDWSAQRAACARRQGGVVGANAAAACAGIAKPSSVRSTASSCSPALLDSARGAWPSRRRC